MICLRCDNEEFVETPDVEIEQELRGELFKVRTTGQTCTMCGWVSVTPAQADELRRRTADAYRKRHGLLTSEEIRGMRRAMGKSQREFAEFLDVGDASVKRWESWQVQDKSSDRLIRLKCLSGLCAAALEATTHTYIEAGAMPLPEWKGIVKAMGGSVAVCAGLPAGEARVRGARSGPAEGCSPQEETCDEVALSLSATCP
jgi:putative zinc finger/helix-turn-helix YgiT family protein